MKKLTRRKMCAALPMVAVVGVEVARGQAGAGGVERLGESSVFDVATMPGRTMANGGESWNVLRGVLATGEAVSVHESMQPKGAVANPAHAIQHSELIAVMEGTVEFEHDGKVERVGAGGLIYVAFGTLHRVRNVGDGPAKYVVVAIGGDVK